MELPECRLPPVNIHTAFTRVHGAQPQAAGYETGSERGQLPVQRAALSGEADPAVWTNCGITPDLRR